MAKKKAIVLIAVTSLMATVSAAAIIGVASVNDSNPIKASTVIENGEITFDATNVVSCTASSVADRYNILLEATTSSGNVYQLHIDNSPTQPADTYAGARIGSLQTYNDIESKIYMTSSFASNAKVFQKINSITVGSKSTASRTLRIFFNGQETYDSLTMAANTTSTFDISNSTTLGGKNARSFNLQYVTSYQTYTLAISQVTINYDCSSDYSDDTTLTSISLSGSQKTEFAVNEDFSYDGLVVTAHYSDLSSSTVVPTGVSSPDMTSVGEKTVTVSYTEGGITKTAEYTIEVVESALKTKYGVKVSSVVLSIDLSTNKYTMVDWDSTVYTLDFSYVISGSTITFTLEDAGDLSNMANYRLFDSSTKGATNSGTIVEGTSITIKTHTPYGTSTNRTFTTAYFD